MRRFDPDPRLQISSTTYEMSYQAKFVLDLLFQRRGLDDAAHLNQDWFEPLRSLGVWHNDPEEVSTSGRKPTEDGKPDEQFKFRAAHFGGLLGLSISDVEFGFSSRVKA